MFFYNIITDPSIKEFIDHPWQQFIDHPARYAHMGQFFWCFGPLGWCMIVGQPTLPLVFALTVASITDPASFGDISSMYAPISHGPCSADILLGNTDCNMNTNPEPYIDIGPWYLISTASAVGIFMMYFM